MTDTIRLIGDTQRAFAIDCIRKAPDNFTVTIKEETRTAAQNRKLWPMLTDIRKQVDWYGQTLNENDWKDMLTASLRKANVVPGIDGGFVTIGLSTSQMGVREFAEFIELIYAFGAEKGVEWSEKEMA